MRQTQNPSTRIAIGALAGLLFTAPLEALFYLGSQPAGLSFAPFLFFEWLARVLPGAVVTRGIDTMVSTLAALGLSVRATSKTAEQVMALAIFLLLGIVGGALYFALAGWLRTRPARWTAGVVLGGLVGLALIGMGFARGQAGVGNVVWLLGLPLLWGLALAWSAIRLVPATASQPETAPGAEAQPAPDTRAVEPLGRRAFLVRLGGASAVVTVVGAVIGAGLQTGAGPQLRAGPGRATTGSTSTTANPTPPPLPTRAGEVQMPDGVRPEYTPLAEHYRIDINLTPPEIDGASWELPLTGLVDNPLTLTVADFQEQRWGEPLRLYITLSCISNQIAGDLIGTTQWTGVPLQRILDEAGAGAEAQYLHISSQDGFYETVPLNMVREDERIMLTYQWDGQPLPAKHGYPLRIYIPDRYGMKQPKWITQIEVADSYEDGYWVERGWDKVAQMKATSVIDTVAVDNLVEQGSQRLVPVGGIAHAGARGIARVEVKVDDGEWTEAHLRTPLSDLTWVLWRYDWPFASGEHTFSVRCTDGEGNPQIAEPSPPHPDGATGIHRVTATVEGNGEA